VTRRAAPQLEALTGLRGLAAWVVVVYHLRTALSHTLPSWTAPVLAKGYLAVDLFFILSGFVLWHAYGATLAQQGLRGAARFWWRRFARIWPLHAVMLALCVALALLLALTGRPAPNYPWRELPLHILLVQNWGWTAHLSWNDPAWSISCEMAAYLLFPALVRVAPWSRLRSGALLGWAAALLLILALYFNRTSLTSDVPHTGLARCLFEFTLGTVLRPLWQRWHRTPAAAPLVAAAGLAALVLGLAFPAPEAIFAPFCLAALILTLALAPSGPARLLALPPLHSLGEISYSTYLAHHVLFALFKLAFLRGTAFITYPQMAAYLALVLAASILLYRTIEKPAQTRLNALLR